MPDAPGCGASPTTGAGRPAVSPPRRSIGAAGATSCAVWNRSSGSLARQVLTTRLNDGGVIGAISEIAGGSARMIAEIKDAWLVPEKAFRPVAIS